MKKKFFFHFKMKPQQMVLKTRILSYLKSVRVENLNLKLKINNNLNLT